MLIFFINAFLFSFIKLGIFSQDIDPWFLSRPLLFVECKLHSIGALDLQIETFFDVQLGVNVACLLIIWALNLLNSRDCSICQLIVKNLILKFSDSLCKEDEVNCWWSFCM